ncbi:beta-lactamase family protein [Calidifontibacter sp. DB0510]|uniref:Beta-lactamase family protein n=1 Tax=Metallococcus carri TaxID=1656884 RepID=A0A967EFY8_9MICO|nr:beta-lactamase family protein [Metallococcus carri]NOP39070.1 beta-lactamase family protein [Calidifontibacter sp. DB2511S]
MLSAAGDRHGVPGAVLGIARGDSLEVHTHGVLNTATGAAVQRDSMFHAGSITKPWTATQVLQLAGEGGLDLDQSIRELVPDAPIDDRITVRQLLNHTSGLDGDRFDDTGRGDDALARYVATLAGAEQITAPGTGYSYCNAGFALLGHLVATLDGTTWEETVRRRFTEPLGLEHTFTLPEDAILHSAAVGHTGTPPRPVHTWQLPRSMGPAGLLCLSAQDLVRFALEVGRAPAYASMLEPQVPIPVTSDGSTDVGLGWRIYAIGGREFFGHDGMTIGQCAFLRVAADAPEAVCLFINLDTSAAAAREVLDAAYEQIWRVKAPDLPAPQGDSYDRGVLGHYERAGLSFDLVERGDGLVLELRATGARLAIAERPYEEYEVRPSGEQFVARSGPEQNWQPLSFGRLPDGRGYLFSGGRLTPRVPPG